MSVVLSLVSVPTLWRLLPLFRRIKSEIDSCWLLNNFIWPLDDIDWLALEFKDDSSGDVLRLINGSKSDIKSRSKGAGLEESRLIRAFTTSLLLSLALVLYEGWWTIPSFVSFVILTGGGSNFSYFRNGTENPRSVLFLTKFAVNGLEVEEVNVDDPNLQFTRKLFRLCSGCH